jgi:hypothetical protein
MAGCATSNSKAMDKSFIASGFELSVLFFIFIWEVKKDCRVM